MNTDLKKLSNTFFVSKHYKIYLDKPTLPDAWKLLKYFNPN